MELRTDDGDAASKLVVIAPIANHSLTLTATEARVLALSASGLRDREIADELGRTEYQIKYAVRNAMIRLGAVTRAHAVAIAISLGHIALVDSSGGDK